MSKVSIICITAREQPGLGRLIDSIKAQDFEGEIELVYGDRLWEKRENHVIALMEEEGVDFKYVRDMPTQPGPCPGGARNASRSLAGGWYARRGSIRCPERVSVRAGGLNVRQDLLYSWTSRSAEDGCLIAF